MNTITSGEVLVQPTPVPLEGEHPPQLRELLLALQRVREGDFSVQLPGDWTGLYGKVADTFNDIVRSNRRMSDELARVGQSVGKQGRRASGCAPTAAAAPGARWNHRSTR